MNWAKGLFRIWIIISVLWGGLFFVALDIPRTFERFNQTRAELDALDGLWPVGLIEDAKARAQAEGDQEEVGQLQRMINESRNGIYRTHERRNYDRATSSLKFVLQVTFIPIAVLGFILFGIWWIAGGFAGRKRD